MRWPWQKRDDGPRREDVLVALRRLELTADRFIVVLTERLAEGGDDAGPRAE